ncbi:MAG: paraquat-inducible protein A [Acetobacteraceae bacterium]
MPIPPLNLTSLLVGTEDATADPPHGLVGCPDCGLIAALPHRSGHGVVHCRRCDAGLERTSARSIDAALACSLAAFLLLFPANFLPLLRVSILGTIHQSVIGSGAVGIWKQGWFIVAIIVGLELVVLPFLRFGLLALVLGTVRMRRRRRWLGPAFRIAEAIDQWAMVDVFLLGGLVAYGRIAPFLQVEIGAGGWAMIVVALLTLVTRASLERRAIWRAIAPEARSRPPDAIACTGCDMVVAGEMAGRRCPRCGQRLARRRPYATMTALAFTLAGFICYPVAYLYPMEFNVRLGMPQPYTIMTGVFKLLDAGFWYFAAVIFIASVAIPLLKLFAIAWFALSIHHESTRRLRLKSRLVRVIHEIGRWSHIDVFTVAVFLPLLQLQGDLSIRIGRGLPAFLAVVVLTMLASDVFDPRELWRASER